MKWFRRSSGTKPTEDRKAKVRLKGGPSDLALARKLYDGDKEAEALAIVERILDLPSGIQPALDHLRELLKDRDVVAIEPSTPVAVPAGRVEMEVRIKLGGAAVSELVSLRGKCLAALLDRHDVPATEGIRQQAIQNSELMIRLFPEDPWFIVLAAQAFYLCDDRDRALALTERARRIDPTNEHTISCYNIFRGGHGTGDYLVLTKRAIEIISAQYPKLERGEQVDVSALLTARNLLQESLEIVPTQARAWAGVALLESFAERQVEAVEALRYAQRYDPSDALTAGVEEAFKKAGWL